MGSLDLTVQVLNISPNTTMEDLIIFFSYCGSIDKIDLQRDGDQAQLAVVTFRQLYAFQTALLLNGATIADRQVGIVPLVNMTSIPTECCTSDNVNNERSGVGFIPEARSAVHIPVVRTQETLSTAKDQVLDRGRQLTGKANSAIYQAANSIRSSIMSSDRLSKAFMWLSNVLGRALRSVAKLSSFKDRNNSKKLKHRY